MEGANRGAQEAGAVVFFFQAEDGIRDLYVTGVQTWLFRSRVVPEETRVEIGPFAVRPYVQADAGILILFDSRRTAAAAFVPPAWFDFDRGWVFHARLAPDAKPTPMAMQTSLGRTKEYLRVGTFTLDVPGRRALKVVAYRPTFLATAAAGLSILFTDATSGKETYGAGRYLDLEPPADGVYTIDFNR